MDCYNQLSQCSICKKPINGKYWQDSANNIFCAEHKKGGKLCKYCGRLTGQEFWKNTNGTVMCKKCHETIVHNKEVLTKLLKKSLHYVVNHLGLQVKEKVYAELKSTQNMNKAAAVSWTPAGLFTFKNGRLYLYILKGRSRDSMITTIAHEYAHAWQSKNTPMNQQGKVIIEGFATWVGCKTAEYYGNPYMKDGYFFPQFHPFLLF